MSLELKHLCKSFGADVHLRDISLSFDADSFNVLLGPAHAGKTSILRVIAGLDEPGSGSVFLHGRDITALEVRKRNIAFVYQEFVNYPTLTVFENIASPMRVRAEKKRKISESVHEIATLLGIENVLDRKPVTLSGGQQQRVAIARALAKDAEVILLDEPLANLDYKLREDLRRDLPRLFEGSGKVVIYAATDPDEAFLLGGNTVVLDEGAVIQVGSGLAMFANPVNISAARILSEFPLNLLAATFVDDKCRVSENFSFQLPEHARALPGGDYTLGFRAEHLNLHTAAPASVTCDATVSVTEMTGNETIIHSVIADQPCVAVVDGTIAMQAGESIDLYLNPDSLFVFDNEGRTVASPFRPISNQDYR